MDLETYRQLSGRTQADQYKVWERMTPSAAHRDDGINPVALCHSVIGALADLHELDAAVSNYDDDNAREEIGDLLWYLAEGARAIGWGWVYEEGFEDEDYKSRDRHELLSDIARELSRQAEYVEHFCWYGRSWNDQGYKLATRELLSLLFALAQETGSPDLNVVMQANLDKLKLRFPEKFDEELSKEENRDREGEARIVSQAVQAPGEDLWKLSDTSTRRFSSETPNETARTPLESTIGKSPRDTRLTREVPEELLSGPPTGRIARISYTVHPSLQGSRIGIGLFNQEKAPDGLPSPEFVGIIVIGKRLYCDKCRTPLSDGMIDRFNRGETVRTQCPDCANPIYRRNDSE